MAISENIKNLLESYYDNQDFYFEQFQSILTPWNFCNNLNTFKYENFIELLNTYHIKFKEDKKTIKFIDKISFPFSNGTKKDIWLDIKVQVLPSTLIQFISSDYSNFCIEFYSSLNFLPFAKKSVIGPQECYILENINVVIEYHKWGYNHENDRPFEYIKLTYLADINLGN